MSTTAPNPASPAPNTGDSPKGFAFALTAYLIWGFLPLYFKLVAHLPVGEVLAQRVLWALPIALVLLIILGRTRDLREALKNPRMLAMAGLTASIVSVNWGIYIYAIKSGQAMEAALGYYINPLFSILLGSILLGERLNRLQWIAVALAAAGVAVLAIAGGSLPLIALSLTLSWGFYAYFKRALPIGPNQGFALEVLLLMPFALGYLIWQQINGTLSFGHTGLRDVLLLLGCGVVTAVPLIVYANGAKLLRLSTIGIMQYISPTMIFLTAVFLFDEPFDKARAIAFPLIWASLVLYTLAMLKKPKA